ncbi:MAG: 2-oxo-tetronate isomerase [Hyphomicrobiaceae bacterium]|nr:2-oxo-tetronate isomerase [Hyphomicrobiaceae bacterium]
MLRFSANLSFLFTELPFLDRFAAAAHAGFTGVEILFPYEWQARDIASRLRAHNLSLVLFNIWPGDWTRGERGLAAIPGREADFETRMVQALKYADEMGALRLHAMAGLAEHGASRATYIGNLRRAARMAAPHGVEILIEPINTRDMPGYHLNRTTDARAVIAEVGEPNIGLQLDLYHRHIEEGDAIGAIAGNADIVRHYQIAGPPDRGEPDGGELDYRSVFRAIDRTGFGGWIGCEYRPRAGTTAGLGWPAALGVSLDGC